MIEDGTSRVKLPSNSKAASGKAAFGVADTFTIFYLQVAVNPRLFVCVK